MKSTKFDILTDAISDLVYSLDMPETKREEVIVKLKTIINDIEAAPALSFHEWLKNQTFRDDPVGDLASDFCAAGEMKPLSEMCREVKDAFMCAEREYTCYRESCVKLLEASKYVSPIHFEEEEDWYNIL